MMQKKRDAQEAEEAAAEARGFEIHFKSLDQMPPKSILLAAGDGFRAVGYDAVGSTPELRKLLLHINGQK